MSPSTSERLSRTLRDRLAGTPGLTAHLPPDPLFHRSAGNASGDYVTGAAIAVARSSGVALREAAGRVAAALEGGGEPGTATVTSSGVIGLTLSRGWLAGELARRLIDDASGPTSGSGRVCIERTGDPEPRTGIRAELASRALGRALTALGVAVDAGRAGGSATEVGDAGGGVTLRVRWERRPAGDPPWAREDLVLPVAPPGTTGGAGDPDPELERYLMLRRRLDRPVSTDPGADAAARAADPANRAPRVASGANPMYTVQRAHAIAATRVRYAGRGRVPETADIASARLDRLDAPVERELGLLVIDRPDVLRAVARTGELPRLVRYLELLAARTDEFLSRCRVVTDGDALAAARLVLLEGARRSIADTLFMLDVRAPERPQGAA